MADTVAGYFPAPIALAFASVAGVSLGLGALATGSHRRAAGREFVASYLTIL